MRKYKTLVLAGLKKQKGSSIGLFLLMFIITISLSCVLCIWSNAESYVQDEMNRVGFGDIVYWLGQTEYMDELKEATGDVAGVEKVTLERSLDTKLVVRGKESAMTSMQLFAEPCPFKLFVGETIDYADEVMPPQKGELYVPISYQAIFGARIGDSVQIKDASKSFTIKGFFEDPTCGSTTMGIKNVLISEADLDEIWKENELTTDASQSTGTRNFYIMRVFRTPDAGIKSRDLQRKISEEVSFENALIQAYSKEFYAQFMLLIENIFVGLLLAFVAVLLMVALIVMGHCISSSLELGYVDLGIQKAIGFTSGNLKLSLFLQYLIVLGLGLLVGLPASSLLVRLINSLIVPVTGIRIPDRMPVLVLMASFGLILLILFVFLMLQVSRIGRISPMMAIRGGKAEVFFTSRFQSAIRGKSLQLSLALRQLTSGAKRYAGACLIASLLVFVLAFCMRIHGWLGEDGSGMMNLLGVASVNGRTYDFAISYEDDTLREEVEAKIAKYSPIQTVYRTQTLSAQLDGNDCLLNVISEPEYFHILEGRTCKYENELVITKMVAADLGLKIGDTIPLAIGDRKKDFIVTGLNQCANDLGNNVSINMEGLDFLGVTEQNCYYNYQIEDPDKEDALLSELKSCYGTELDVDSNTWSGIEGIVGAANALKLLMFVICTIFIFVVVFLTGSKILYQEQHDLGVYKALGFYSGQLRASFALRFFLVAVIGAVIGMVMGMALTDPIASRMFYLLGVGSFETPFDIPQMVACMLFVVTAFLVSAYLVAGRIRKTDPGILITE